MPRVLPGIVKRGLKAMGSRLIKWLREWTRPDNHGLVGGAVADATRSKSELMLENALVLAEMHIRSNSALNEMFVMVGMNLFDRWISLLNIY